MSTTARRIATAAAALAGLSAAAWLAAPALSLRPYVPRVREFAMADGAFEPAARASAARVRASAAHPTARRALTYASPLLRAPARFNVAGITWRGPAHLKIRMRVRRDGGAWSRWTAVPDNYEEGPDRDSPEVERSPRSTRPVWAGQVDHVQYSARGPLARVRGLRLRFVNSTGTATPSDRWRTAIRRTAHGAAAGVAGIVRPLFGAVAGASSGGVTTGPTYPGMITRSQWGADSQCQPRTQAGEGEVKVAFVHHTVSLNSYSAGDSAALVLGICRYHRNTNGWNDIGYNFLVDKYGQVFEGREGGADKAVVGAQAQGYNSASTGVANIGDFMSVSQTQAGLDALERLLAWKLALHGVVATGTIDVTSGGGSQNRYPSGAQVTLNRIAGHRDGDSTDCPGDSLYAQLPEIRAATDGYMQGAGPAAAKLSLASTPGKIAYRQAATLSGLLAAPDGTPLAGHPVRLQRTGGGGWKTVSTATTDAQGAFSQVVRPTTLATYRARYSGSTETGAARSKRVKVAVQPLLTLTIAARRSGAGTYLLARRQAARARGRVDPPHSQVVLSIKRREPDGTLRRVYRAAVTAKGGRFSALFHPSRATRYLIRAYFKGDRGHAAARSPEVEALVR